MRPHSLALLILAFMALAAEAKTVVLDYAASAPKAVATVSTLATTASAVSADGLLRSYSFSPSRLATAAAAVPSSSAAALNIGDTVILGLFDDVSLTVRVTRVSFDAFGAVYAGSIDGVNCVSFIPVGSGFQIDAQAVAADRVYKVLPSGSSTTVQEFEPPKGGHCGNDGTLVVSNLSSAASVTMATASSYTTASTLIDLLVVYDTNAVAWVKAQSSDITNFARAAVEKANNALANTGLDTNFNFRLVGVAAFATNLTDVSIGLSTIRPNSTAYNPAAPFTNIDTLRTSVGADDVVLLIDTGSAYGTTGLGYSLESDPVSSFAPFAYCCCSIRSVNSSHTMTHEVGHNLGAGHSNMQSNGGSGPQWATKSYSSGFHFIGATDGVPYHTIMGYDSTGLDKTYYYAAPYYSSPRHSYQGTVVGTVASNDNTRVLKETYAAASAWRTQKIPVTSGVTFSPEDGTLFDTNLIVTLTPGAAGIPIYYTLDGTTPTTSSTLYTNAFSISTKTTIRAITYSNGTASPVYLATYQTVGDVLGVTNAVWSRGGVTLWYQAGDGVMQNGDFSDSITNGASTLQGVFTGKGTLVYTLSTSSYTWQNGVTITVDGTQTYRKYYDGVIATNLVFTNTFTTTGPHLVKWTYTVGDYSHYFSSDDCYALLGSLTWAPVATATTNAVPVPYSWLSTYYPSLSTDAQYNDAALADSDGDGFAAWEEYLAGTDPTNAASYFRALIRMDGLTPVIEWNVTNSGLATYTILGATNLTDTFAAPTNAVHRFFKVRADPK